MTVKFTPSAVYATPAVMAKVSADYASAALNRHVAGDWGLCDAEDSALNGRNLRDGGSLMSVFPLPDDPDVFWIITEADRSKTTFLLPSDY
jgi:hypothetical protein